MEKYETLLKYHADEKYRIFSAKLTPNVDESHFLGVRVPTVRSIAKSHIHDDDVAFFYKELPHKFFDENMLHALFISEEKDFQKVLSLLKEFLSYVDNWAVCDILSPKCFKRNKDLLLKEIKNWISSSHIYTERFGIEMLMSHFLDNDFKEEYLYLPLKANGNDYYLKMMKAWFYATALAKQWDCTITILKNHLLDDWTHNKTIQKAVESYRITDNQKNYLKTLKIKKSID